MGSVGTFLSQDCWPPMLVLTMLLLESLGDDLLLDPESEFDSYEITIPKLLNFRQREKYGASPMSYLLQLKGKKHVLHLWPKKFLLSRHLGVFSFTEEGELLEDDPYIPRDCNYMGSVEGSQDSKVTLSTCTGGLRGIVNIDAMYYQIEPLEASSSFEHIVYLLKEEQFSNQTCGLTDDEIDWQMAPHETMARQRDFHLSYMHKKYMELMMIFDLARFKFMNRNISRVVEDAVLLTAIIDTYFQEINLRMHLKYLEVWTDYERIYTQFPKLAEVLGQFVIYKRSSLTPRAPTDWAHLYLHRKYIDALAWSWGRVCEPDHAGSACSFLDASLLGPATWTTHELGHCLGMRHDEQYCHCRGRRSCIMGTGRRGFSNCSYLAYFKYTSRSAKCLDNIPQGYVEKKCGNKIMDDDEECDCGSEAECRKDPCCGPNCRLKLGVNCSFGLCCRNCHFLPSGYVCREEENECDLAEYCNGTSGLCPEDTYKQDGTPCKYEGLCFRKGCRSRHMQCQSIFGPDAREAPKQCYEAVNVKGDQYGNCDATDAINYKKCAKENAICGRLQCINVKKIPDLPEHTTVISTFLQEENLMCWGTGYHQAMKPTGIPDTGTINDGTSCGEKQVCINRTCVHNSVLKFDCLPEKCNRRGICNTKKNCHCMYGWAPPFCEEVGYGGSLNSGPPGPMTEEVPSPFDVVFFMLLRLILFAISVIVVFLRHMIIKILTQQNTKKSEAKNVNLPKV